LKIKREVLSFRGVFNVYKVCSQQWLCDKEGEKREEEYLGTKTMKGEKKEKTNK
jgi:hypothetical protein